MSSDQKQSVGQRTKPLYHPIAALVNLPQDRIFTGYRAFFTVVWVEAICTLAGMLCSRVLDHENVIMIYLLGLTYVATRCGFRTCILACLISVVAFDYFIVPPRFSFVPTEPQFLFTFLIMFFVAAVITVLVNRMHKQQTSLQQSRVLDLTNDGIIEWGLSDQKIHYFNAGAERLFGISKELAVGSNIQNLLSGDYPDYRSNLFEKIRLDGHWEGEIVYQDAEGEPITVFSRWTIANDNDGKPLNVVEFITDITDRKKAEIRVKEFYSTVSHELRTPLTAIRGGLSLLEHGIIEQGSDEARELILLGRTQADRLMTLINDILDLQKIESGKFDLFPTHVVIENIISSVVSELHLMAAGVQVVLVKNIESDAGITVDVMRISQVLTNLLANAIKFSPPGSQIQISSTLQENRLRVSVIDHGPGIDSKQIPKLFKRFQQLDSSDSRRYSGTGLGLAISKAIIEQHNGIIGVDSEPGKGSTFWFELQCSDQNNELRKSA